MTTEIALQTQPLEHRCVWELEWKTNPWRAYVATVQSILQNPVTYFSGLQPFRDNTSLFTFIFINFALGGLGALFLIYLPMLLPLAAGAMAFAGISIIGLIFLFALYCLILPFFSLIALLGFAVIWHFFLKVIGGSRKPLSMTITVVGLQSVASTLTLVPFVGALAALVYHLIIGIGGSAKAHGISVPRTILAALFPYLLAGFLMLSTLILILFNFNWSK